MQHDTEYAYTLRDPDTGKVVMRTNEEELAQRYARALARMCLARVLEEREREGVVARMMARIMGVTR